MTHSEEEHESAVNELLATSWIEGIPECVPTPSLNSKPLWKPEPEAFVDSFDTDASGKGTAAMELFSYSLSNKDLLTRLRERAREVGPPTSPVATTVQHTSLQRHQTRLGVLDKVNAAQPPNPELFLEDPVVWKEVQHFKEGVGHRRVRVQERLETLNPRFIAKEAYGLDLPQGDGGIPALPKRVGKDIKNLARVLWFLADAFDAIQTDKRFDQTLPIGMVRRITDLTKAYNLHGDKKGPVFRAVLVFDGEDEKRRQTLEVLLPDIKDEAQIARLKEGLDPLDPDSVRRIDKVLEILSRNLCASVSNYGMIMLWKSLDIDFSNSRYPVDALGIHPFWKERMDSCTRRCGFHVFQRYLENATGGILSFTNGEDIGRFLTPAKLSSALQLPSTSNQLGELDGKYVLGIDIGGTAVKLQIYQLTNVDPKLAGGPVLEKIGGPADDGRLYIKEMPDSTECPTKGPKPFKDADDFAGYVIGSFITASRNWQEVLTNTVAVGVSWPGAVLGNKLAGVSGTIKNFLSKESKDAMKATGKELPDGHEKTFTGRIMVDGISDVHDLDIAGAFRRKLAELSGQSQVPVTVALLNDGDAEAIGSFWNLAHTHQDLFDHQYVAFLKAGTGTAGGVLAYGSLLGFNEFGKLIIDLGFDNAPNEDPKKKEDDRWPQGDANKFFSMSLLRTIAKNVRCGHKDGDASQVDGLDLKILMEMIDSGERCLSDKYAEDFGALQLSKITQPAVTYSDLGNPSRALRYDKQKSRYELIEVPGSPPDPLYVDSATMLKLLREPLAGSQDSGWRLIDLSPQVVRQMTLKDLLIELGRARFSWLRFQGILENPADSVTLRGCGKTMGKRLADVVAALTDVLPDLKAIVASGGPVKGAIAEDCCKELKKALPIYLKDRHHDDDNKNKKPVSGDLAGAHPRDPRLLVEFPALSDRSVQNAGTLGTALLGFQFHIRESKIAELQRNDGTGTNLQWATEDEWSLVRAQFVRE